MNPKHTDQTDKKAFWLRWPFWVTAIPLCMLLLGVLAVAINEKLALDRIQAELARMRAAGHPIDDASMTQWFLDHTSQEGTAAWNEVLRVVAAGPSDQMDQLPYVGIAPIPTEIQPGGDWPEEQEVTEYLRWMRAVIEQIHEATDYPTPVWQPIQFRGYMTLLEELQNSRSLTRLLSLDVEHALYHGDAERALRSLASMRSVADAFDWQLCIVAELVNVALRNVHQSMICRSLACDLWSEDQLQVLREQLEPARDVPERWRRVIGGERAMMISAITDSQFWQDDSSAAPGFGVLLSVPSLREGLIGVYRETEAIGAAGLPGLSERARRRDRAWQIEAESERSIFAFASRGLTMIYPATFSFARAIEREEDSRRLALTAVAVKSFQLRNGHWPEQLPELEQVGLTANDWNTVSGGPFGYEVQAEEVFLWSYDHSKELRVSATRPEANADQPQAANAWVTIR